jgi:hypothetical protein
MALSTLAAAKAAYLANNLYDVHNSTSEAASFVEACRALLLLLPSVVQEGRLGHRQEMDPENIRAECSKAERWYRAAVASSSGRRGVRYPDFSNFRG